MNTQSINPNNSKYKALLGPALSLLMVCLTAHHSLGQAFIDLTMPISKPVNDTLKLGGNDPAGIEINSNTQYLTLNGKPWTPVMGEFHFMRFPRADWDRELKKMKAGGITIVSTYVIWIFHEEIQGRFDWSDNKDLTAFIEACANNGLKVSLRIGPWAHSEARNGGIPDWVVQRCGKSVRTTDPQFMALTSAFYEQIFKQVKGMFWKDGGPIINVQIDNESTQIPYLQALKAMAIKAGFDVPLYSITAWDHVRPPDSGLLPMFGGYPEGFWYEGNRVPEKARTHYFFTPVRDDSEIDPNNLLSIPNSLDLTYINKFPFLTCEVGAGMAIAYDRRPVMSWKDVTASALAQLGAGANLLGYYMYHGGANPLGKDGQGLQEKQDSPTTNWNDLPPIRYDFQAPIGEYGQVRPVYHSLGLLHNFIADFGPELATWPPVFPQAMPTSVNDTTTLRWAVRTNAKSGYVFINNYERGQDMPARREQLNLKMPEQTLKIPATGYLQIPPNSFMILPFNIDLNGTLLKYASAQLICRIDDNGTPLFVFFSPSDMKSDFAFANASSVSIDGREIASASDGLAIATPTPGIGTSSFISVKSRQSQHAKILLLTQAQAMHLFRTKLWGADRLIVSSADLSFDGERVLATSRDSKSLSISVYPPATGAANVTVQDKALPKAANGAFVEYSASVPEKPVQLHVTKLKDAGPARALKMGSVRVPPVPTEPTDADFETAGIWKIDIPADAVDEIGELYIKIHYVGDAARAYIGNKYIDDDFWFGEPWEIGIKRFMPGIVSSGLTLKLLPLRKDSPIFLEPDKVPGFAAKAEDLEMDSITAEAEYCVTMLCK